jgi:hypothetical protein
LLLDSPADLAAALPRFRPVLPWRWLVSLAALLGLALLARELDWIGGGPVRAVGVAAAHGALFASALASADPRWRFHAAVLMGGLAAAAAATEWSPWGALAYLAIPVALGAVAAREPGLARIGLCGAGSWRLLVVGALAGGLLGAHLLVSASRTLGYEMRVHPLDRYLTAVAYDVGANVPSAECFFRGVLFNAAQRRWPLALALAATMGPYLVRYLVDPALPRAVETITGAMFYLTLLGAANCGLFWRSGSVLPGMLAGLGFFGAYRALGGSW